MSEPRAIQCRSKETTQSNESGPGNFMEIMKLIWNEFSHMLIIVAAIYDSNFKRNWITTWVIPIKYIVERVCKNDACEVPVNPLS